MVLFYPGGVRFVSESQHTLTYDRMLSPLAPLQPDILLFNGVANTAGDRVFHKTNEGHAAGMRTILTGDSYAPPGEITNKWGPTDSIDQTIARAIAGSVRFPSLQFGVFSDHGPSEIDQRRISFAGSVPQPPINDPGAMFKRLFPDAPVPATPPPAPAGGAPAAPPAAAPPSSGADRRRSMLDLLEHEIAALQRVAGTHERQKLDQHLSALRDLERQIPGATGGAAGTPAGGGGSIAVAPPMAAAGCAPPTQAAGVTTNNNPNGNADSSLPAAQNVAASMDVPRILQLQLDLLYQSLVCDLTRVATFQLMQSAQASLQYPWLGIPDVHHSLEHGQHEDNAKLNTGDRLEKVQTWVMEQMGGFIKRLKATPEGGGTMLDNTLVFVVTELGDGGAHSHNPFLAFTAGRAGGRVTPGRTMDLKTSLNNLLLGLLATFGVNQAKIGDADLCTGPVSLT